MEFRLVLFRSDLSRPRSERSGSDRHRRGGGDGARGARVSAHAPDTRRRLPPVPAVRRHQAVPRPREPARAGRPRRHGRRPDRGPLCGHRPRAPPDDDPLAVTAVARVMTVGGVPGAALADPEGAAVAAALVEARLADASRVVLDQDDAARALAATPGDWLTD